MKIFLDYLGLPTEKLKNQRNLWPKIQKQKTKEFLERQTDGCDVLNTKTGIRISHKIMVVVSLEITIVAKVFNAPKEFKAATHHLLYCTVVYSTAESGKHQGP